MNSIDRSLRKQKNSANLSDLFANDVHNSTGEQPKQNRDPTYPCCTQLRSENHLLRRALRKEREKRQFIGRAYQELLRSYETLIDLKNALDLPSMSISSDEIDGRDLHSSIQKQKTTATSTFDVLVPRSIDRQQKHTPQQQCQPKLTEVDNYYAHNKESETQKHYIQRDAWQQQRHSKTMPTAPAVEAQYHASVPTRQSVRIPFADNTSLILNRQSMPQQKQRVRETSATTLAQPELEARKTLKQWQKQQQHSNWYFVPLDENDFQGRAKTEFAKRKRFILLCRSEARCQAIMDASRERAALVANRRAVLTDLLKGKRQLDDDALRVLHSDSSQISAFPGFMQHMRSVSKRRFAKSPVRHQQVLDRQKLYAKATNQILAHSSATISRMLAKAQMVGGSNNNSPNFIGNFGTHRIRNQPEFNRQMLLEKATNQMLAHSSTTISRILAKVRHDDVNNITR